MHSYTTLRYLFLTSTVCYLAPEVLFIIQDTTNFGANQPTLFELVQIAVSDC